MQLTSQAALAKCPEGAGIACWLPLAEQDKDAQTKWVPHVPLLTLMYPLLPKDVPQEFLINQYGTPYSVPHPTARTEEGILLLKHVANYQNEYYRHD